MDEQIISIHIGQAGLQLGEACWDLYCLEHGIPPDGVISEEENSHLDRTFFSEKGCTADFVRRRPRGIFIDLEEEVMMDLRCGVRRHLYHPNNMITGQEDTANNYARGYFTNGRKIIDRCLDAIRKLTWNCCNFKGFMIFSSIGGGTSSGFGSLLMEALSDEYEKKTKMCFNIYPDPKISPIIVEPYNSIMSIRSLLEHSDISLVLDNRSIHRICKKYLDIEKPNYTHFNKFLAHVISSTTSSMRFKGSLNTSISEFPMNLVPVPRLSFILGSYSPIIAYGDRVKIQSVAEITNSAFEKPELMLAPCCPQMGKYITSCSLMYRGDIVPNDINEAIQTLKSKKIVNFVDWSPTDFKFAINPPSKHNTGEELANEPYSVCMLSNSTAISGVFSNIRSQFDLMYSKRAFVHWYVGEGMEEDELCEAREEVIALEKDYEDAYRE